ncbi:hypothetical protein GWI33_002776, partial [Rhynchophorus ferrugineus]
MRGHQTWIAAPGRDQDKDQAGYRSHSHIIRQ